MVDPSESSRSNKQKYRLSIGSKPVEIDMDSVRLHRTLSQPVRLPVDAEEEQQRASEWYSGAMHRRTMLQKGAQLSPLLNPYIPPSIPVKPLGSHGTIDPKVKRVSFSKEENFSKFRTRSSRAPSRQTSTREPCGNQIPEIIKDDCSDQSGEQVNTKMPAGRYFDALEGPEFEILKGSEDVLLPLDKPWPFLLRFPITCFGICLGLGSQSILWKNMSLTFSVHFLHVPRLINIIIWCLALCSLIIIFSIYCFKCFFYFEAVKKEYYHPVRINFFFAPWIACMFLTIGVPPAIATSIHPSLFCIFMVPVFLLELKIYGQWLSGGERRLSKVANPSSHLSIVGNFVGALLGTLVGFKEAALFFWAVGLAHYLVLFVTLYQRLPTSEALPRELHPVFFLFIAAPSTASVAWEGLTGDFDRVSRIVYFTALFLFTSLIVRIKLFRGLTFSLAWWAYTFPTTAASIATVKYSQKVTNTFTQSLALILSIMSTIAVTALFITTMLHAFYWRSLFSNDVAIAITHTRRTPKNWKFLYSPSSLNAFLPEKQLVKDRPISVRGDDSCMADIISPV